MTDPANLRDALRRGVDERILPTSDTHVRNIDLAFLSAVNEEIGWRTREEAHRQGLTDLRSPEVTEIYREQHQQVVDAQGVDEAELDRVIDGHLVAFVDGEYIEAGKPGDPLRIRPADQAFPVDVPCQNTASVRIAGLAFPSQPVTTGTTGPAESPPKIPPSDRSTTPER